MTEYFQVEDALLVIYYADGSKADIFHMDSTICSKYWLLWFERLSSFHNKSRRIGNGSIF